MRELGRRSAELDGLPAGRTVGGARVRRFAAVLLLAYSVYSQVQTNLDGSFISPLAFVLSMIAVALYLNRTGRFVRDWVPVLVGIVAYGVTVKAVPRLGVPVHYTPQIDADKVLGFGTLPTTWLQEHLYGGHTGPLEVFSLAMYLSHFLAPLILAFLLWTAWNGRGFHDLLFGILAVSILGDITFLAAPTAPPWLAADHGLIPPVHPVIRDALYDLHLNSVAARKGDPSSYNIVAAVPSLHVAWPVICLLVIRKHQLPKWLLSAQALLALGIVFAVVYTGEHYLVDGVVGIVYALAAWWLVQWILARRQAAQKVHPHPAPAPASN
jgi:membrane-associated phospholipid phosphatase